MKRLCSSCDRVLFDNGADDSTVEYYQCKACKQVQIDAIEAAAMERLKNMTPPVSNEGG